MTLFRKLIWLSIALMIGGLLTGCDKILPYPWGPNQGHSTQPLNVIALGDSQSFRFSTQGGLTGLYSKYPQINLVNCGVPSSHMGQWDSDGQVDWENCKAMSKGLTIDVVIVFIGTNDTGYQYSLPYSQMMINFLGRIKTQWHPSHVFYVQIGDNNSSYGYPYWQYVQDEQASVSVSVQGCTMIPSTGLATQPLPDGIHFLPDSFKQIGDRIASEL